jgi:hypothetical protein
LKVKKILRFYFCADKLNSSLDNLIERFALCSFESDRECMYYANKILKLIEVKTNLSLVWGYLNGILQKFDEEETGWLIYYSNLRCGLTHFDCQKYNNVHRVLVKFSRRAANVDLLFEEGLKLIDCYYALL